jgi:hypothetical protein
VDLIPILIHFAISSVPYNGPLRDNWQKMAAVANKEIHKLFDRSTPAGAAMYALYNATENESRTAGNAYSRRNAVRIAAQGRRAVLRAATEPERACACCRRLWAAWAPYCLSYSVTSARTHG